MDLAKERAGEPNRDQLRPLITVCANIKYLLKQTRPFRQSPVSNSEVVRFIFTQSGKKYEQWVWSSNTWFPNRLNPLMASRAALARPTELEWEETPNINHIMTTMKVISWNNNLHITVFDTVMLFLSVNYPISFHKTLPNSNRDHTDLAGLNKAEGSWGCSLV